MPGWHETQQMCERDDAYGSGADDAGLVETVPEGRWYPRRARYPGQNEVTHELRPRAAAVWMIFRQKCPKRGRRMRSGLVCQTGRSTAIFQVV